MKKTITTLIISLQWLLFSACSTSLKVVTQPAKANVFITGSILKKERKLGVTPFTHTAKKLTESMAGVGKPGELITLRVELEDHKDFQIMLPLSSAGVLTGEINLTLEKNTEKNIQLKTAKELLDQMFLAQSFARLKQFERALIEIDKVITVTPKLARALSMKASIYYAQGLFKESLTWYEKAIDVDKQMKSAIEMIAKVKKRLRLPASIRK